LKIKFISFCYSLPEHTVPDLMFFENHAAEHHHDDANMHHFLDTNLYRARPRVRKSTQSVKTSITRLREKNVNFKFRSFHIEF